MVAPRGLETVCEGFVESDVFGVLLVVSALGALQGVATWNVWRSDLYERPQKVAQTRLIWLMPLIGAISC